MMFLFHTPSAFWDAAWLTGLAALITACAGAAGTILGNLHRDRKTGEKINKISKQVTNNHGTNLRDDVDRVLNNVDHVADQLEHLVEKVEMVNDSVKKQSHDMGELKRASDLTHEDHAARLRKLEAHALEN